MKSLRVASQPKSFSFPLDAATSTFGILAKKGAGKSNSAVVIAEEMYDAGIPWVAVDPKGDWWGMRSSEDGKGPGLPIVVFGGRHGDVPLEPSAGALIADLVLDQRLTCVLDVSEFSKADVRRFLLAFADRLYREAEDEPLHLFLEEAHEYLPQMVRGDDANLVAAWQRIVKQGRFKGLGVTLISQRSASLNKDVLTQVDSLIVLRTTSPQDRKAVKDWVDVNSDHMEMIDTLPSLADGEAWVWSPELMQTLTRITFRRRRTFDSGATPKVGQKARRAPATLADVDLAVIKEQMAETIEKAKASDPKVLQQRVRDLEREVAALRDHECVAAEPQVVEKPYIPQIVADLHAEFINAEHEVEEALAQVANARRKLGNVITNIGVSEPAPAPILATGHPRPVPPPLPPRQPVRIVKPPTSNPASDVKLGKAERAIVTVLAQFGSRNRNQLAFLSGYHANSKGFANSLSAMRTQGLITSGPDMSLTPEGQAIADTLDVEPLPRGRDLLEHFKGLGKVDKAGRLILDVLYERSPLSRVDLAEACGYHPNSKGFANSLSRMRTLGFVVDGPAGLQFGDDLQEALR